MKQQRYLSVRQRSLSLSCDCSSIYCGNGFICDIIIAKIKQHFKINMQPEKNEKIQSQN